MFSRLFKSEGGINNPEMVRDVMIEFMESLKPDIANKAPIENIINKISKKDITIQELISAYRELLVLSEKSIGDDSLKAKGRILPINPSDPKIIEKIKNIIERRL